jgi:hypothetical protein
MTGNSGGPMTVARTGSEWSHDRGERHTSYAEQPTTLASRDLDAVATPLVVYVPEACPTYLSA